MMPVEPYSHPASVPRVKDLTSKHEQLAEPRPKQPVNLNSTPPPVIGGGGPGGNLSEKLNALTAKPVDPNDNNPSTEKKHATGDKAKADFTGAKSPKSLMPLMLMLLFLVGFSVIPGAFVLVLPTLFVGIAAQHIENNKEKFQ